MANGYNVFMEKIYFSYSSVYGGDIISLTANLPSVILNRVNAHKTENKRLESLTAWSLINNLLFKVTGKWLCEYNLTFSPNGKPLIDNGFISLSHSNGVVAVGYSKADFGLDIEVCKNAEKYTAVAKKLGVSVDNELFLKWTAVESVTKLNDKYKTSFNGEVIKSTLITVNGYDVAVSIAGNNEFYIENV